MQKVIEFFKKKNTQQTPQKKHVFVLLSILVLLIFGLIFGVIFFAQGNEEERALEVEAFQEEPVMRGNIVVGLSETGSVDMDDTALSLGFESTIVETFVAAGSYVNEGEELLQIDTEDFQALYDAKEAELHTAELQLEQALIDAGIQQSNADYDYNTSVQNGNTAAGVYALQLSQLDSGYATILNEITSLEQQKASIERQISQGLDNDHGLATYQSELAAIDAQIIATQEQISHAQTCLGATDPSCTQPTQSHDVAALESTLIELSAQQTQKAAQVSQAQADYDKSLQELQTQLTTVQENLTKQYNERDTYSANMPIQQLEYSNQYNASIQDSATAGSEHDSTMTQIETSLSQAQQAVDNLENEMEIFSQISQDGILTATQDGYVLNLAETNTLLEPNTALITLADDAMVRLSVSIPQEDIADISMGMQTNVVLDAYEDQSLPATVESISIVPSGNMQSSINYTVSVACSLDAYPDLVVYEGMTAEVTFVQRQVEDVLLVSNKCITSEDGQQYVQRLAEDGSIERVLVQTGFSDGFDVEITEGLVEGDIVLIENVVTANETA